MACAAGLLLGSSSAFAQLDPYAGNYGFQRADVFDFVGARDTRGWLDIDANGNLWTGGRMNGVGGFNGYGAYNGGTSIVGGIGQFDQFGNLLFGVNGSAEALAPYASQHYANHVAIDSNGNVFQSDLTRQSFPGAPITSDNNDGYLQRRNIATPGTLDYTTQINVERYDPLSASNWDNVRGVAVDGDDNVWVGGYNRGILLDPSIPASNAGNYGGTGDYDPFLVKINNDGSYANVGIQPLGGSLEDRAFAVAADKNHDVVAIAGYSYQYSGGETVVFGETHSGASRDGWVGIYSHGGAGEADNALTELGHIYLGAGQNGSALYAMDFFDNGDIAVGGYTNRDGLAGSGLHELYIARYQTDGTLVWEQKINDETGADSVELVVGDGFNVDEDDNLVLSGYTNGDLVANGNADNQGSNDAFFMKVDGTTGATIWATQNGSAASDAINGFEYEDKDALWAIFGTRGDFTWAPGGYVYSGDGQDASVTFKVTPGDFNGDQIVGLDDLNALGVDVHDGLGSNVVPGDFVSSGTIELDDLQYMITEVFDTRLGDGALDGGALLDQGDADVLLKSMFNSTYQAIVDMNEGGGATDGTDESLFFTAAGTERGFAFRLARSDLDFDGQVQLPDFAIFRAGFGVGTTYAEGDLDGSGDVQLPDFAIFRADFGYDANVGPGAVAEGEEAEALPGEVDLIIGTDGSLTLDGGNVDLEAYSIRSAGNLLIPDGDANASPFQFYLRNAADQVAGANIIGVVNVNGLLLLDAAIDASDLGLLSQDVLFEYNVNGETIRGNVIVLPEPASLALLGLGGLLILRRRR
jgi:hypothetical protein